MNRPPNYLERAAAEFIETPATEFDEIHTRRLELEWIRGRAQQMYFDPAVLLLGTLVATHKLR